MTRTITLPSPADAGCSRLIFKPEAGSRKSETSANRKFRLPTSDFRLRSRPQKGLTLKRAVILPVVVVLLACFGLQAQEVPTYFADIKPIIDKNCVDCHRSGEAAPFTLQTYEEVSKRASFIYEVTKSRYMPPWYADPEFRHFKNQRILSQAEIDLIGAWVAGGKKKGNAPPKAAMREQATTSYPDPDIVLKMTPFTIPGNNEEQFRLFIIPTDTEKELYVKGVDFRPSNLQLAHHARVMIDTTHLFRPDNGAMVSDTVMPRTNLGVQLANYFWYGWVPGTFTHFYPPGIGRRLPKASDLLLNMHYSPSPKDALDQSTIRLYLCEEKPRRLVKSFVLDESWVVNQPFHLPANTQVKFTMRSPRLPQDISLISILPHMHLLGKSFKAYAITPRGEIIFLIKIDDWNFNWQMTYQFDQLIHLPKGSVIYAEAVYDNTANNPRNPYDPPRDIDYGWGTNNEMMNLILEYLDYEPGDEKLDLFAETKPSNQKP